MLNQIAILGLAAQAAAMAVPPSINARTGEIVGGEKANIEDFPYQANFYVGGGPDCGGTILNKNTIVTAAHCTYQSQASDFSIRVGSSDLYGGTVYNVSTFYQHPQFVYDTLDYDVSVLKLDSDLVFGSGVQPIGGLTDAEPAAGSQATVSGWGSLHEGEGDSNDLEYVTVPIVDRNTCSTDYNGAITSRMICAGVKNGGKDSCQGDSGGPFVANGKLVGIVSWGKGCARKDLPGIYTNVANQEIHDWITQHA